MKTPEEIYDASLDAFRESSCKFSAVVEEFRAGKVSDNTFFAARAAFNRAKEVVDRAETEFIIAKNS